MQDNWGLSITQAKRGCLKIGIPKIETAPYKKHQWKPIGEKTGNNRPKGAPKAPFLFVYGLHDLTEKLQTPGKIIWYRKACSQAASLDFMVKFQNVICHGQDGPFGIHLDISPEEETSEVHIFFRHGKSSLRLDATIKPKKFSKGSMAEKFV